MKNRNVTLEKPMSLLITALLLFFMMACQEEVLNDELQHENKGKEEATAFKGADNAKFGSGVCFPVIVPGRIVWTPPFIYDCINEWGACNTYTRECIPWLNPCAVIPCGLEWRNPWDIYEKLRYQPELFGSLRDAAQLEINPATTAAHFPVNSDVLGLQFYKEREGMLSYKGLHLRTAMELDQETIENNQLEGNVIPAGKYPVIFNKENGTFNAFASVTKFPVKYDRSILQIVPEYFKGSINELFGEFYLKEHPNSNLIETSVESHRIEPNLSEKQNGVYIFSANQYDLNIIFYGDPDPQPNSWNDPTPTPVKVWMDESMWLDQKLAEYLGIQPFLMEPENIHQAFDEKEGILRVTIMR